MLTKVSDYVTALMAKVGVAQVAAESSTDSTLFDGLWPLLNQVDQRSHTQTKWRQQPARRPAPTSKGWSIGTMQGRMVPAWDGRIQSFPRDRWEEDLKLARKAGFDCLEWLYDAKSADENPLATEAGIAAVRAASRREGIAIHSICAHYFVERPLLDVSEMEQKSRAVRLMWLLKRAASLGASRVVVPMESAAGAIGPEHIPAISTLLKPVLQHAERTGVEIHLEAGLAPMDFSQLLGQISHPHLKVAFDVGDAAYLGHSTAAAFKAYGKRIGTIHIKDKSFHGPSVALGGGAAELAVLFERAHDFRFDGDFIFEIARCVPGEELKYVRRNMELVSRHLESAFGSRQEHAYA